MGFGAPMSDWLRGDFGKRVESDLLSRACSMRPTSSGISSRACAPSIAAVAATTACTSGRCSTWSRGTTTGSTASAAVSLRVLVTRAKRVFSKPPSYVARRLWAEIDHTLAGFTQPAFGRNFIARSPAAHWRSRCERAVESPGCQRAALLSGCAQSRPQLDAARAGRIRRGYLAAADKACAQRDRSAGLRPGFAGQDHRLASRLQDRRPVARRILPQDRLHQ